MDERAPLDEEEFSGWRAEADGALAGWRVQRDAGLHNWACFSAEQAAQLAVKGLLHGLGRGPWGHDLARLAEALREANTAAPGEVVDRRRRLGRHYIPARYPDAHPSGPPALHYGASDSDEAVADAEAILSFVDGAWDRLRVEAPAVWAPRREQDRLIGLARQYVDDLAARVPIVAAAVVGSVARGDFNVWSDVDVVVVAEGLPARLPDRLAALATDAPPGVQPVGFLPAEFITAWRKRNRLVVDAVAGGVPLIGGDFLARVPEQRP